MDKDTVIHSLKLFGQLIVVNILNIFICLSFMFICTAAFTKDIGYSAVVYDKDNNEVEKYAYYSADGEDAKLAEYPEADGYKISKQTIKSPLSGTGNVVFRLLTQTFTLLLTIGFIYPKLWQLGAKDSNLVKFKHRVSDPLRGLKIGLTAQIPALLLLISFFIFMRNVPLKLYALLNSSFYALIDMIGGTKSFGQIGVFQAVALFLLLLIVPAVSAGAYLLGLKDISLSERFIYSKNKNNR